MGDQPALLRYYARRAATASARRSSRFEVLPVQDEKSDENLAVTLPDKKKCGLPVSIEAGRPLFPPERLQNALGRR